jgi:Sec-independent protein translocase protein TatA
MAYENVILVVILIGTVFFGAKRLPELARSLGRAQTEYEKARIEARKEIRSNSSYGDNNDTSTSVAAAAGHSSRNAPIISEGPGTTTKEGNHQANNAAAAAITKVSESNNNSSLVVTAAAASADSKTTIDRAKLQNAAKKIGVENPEKLSDDELRDAIRNNLDL